MKEDLLPFWTNKDALGEPLGNFPTYRSNNGSIFDLNNPPKEFVNVVPGIVFLDRDYVRAKSRQIFAYGVAYNMTGDERFLIYAKAGIDYLIKNAFDNYGSCSWFTVPERKPSPDPKHRTSQDLAYSVSGIAFYYYLTRDSSIEREILKLKKYIFDTYWDENIDMFRWVLAPNQDQDTPDQKKLVSQLDQIYGYLLLLASTLPINEQEKAKRELKDIARVIVEHFFVNRHGLFWGSTTTTEGKQLDTSHTDFGHSVKAMWMIMQIGKLNRDLELFNFGKNGAIKIINHAYDKNEHKWIRGYKKNPYGSDWILDYDQEWWALAVLDQVAATLSLIDPYYAEILTHTYDFWFKHMVDHENHGIWHMLDYKANLKVGFPKQHSWKNALHTFEHALIGYMCSQQFYNLDFNLYFAFDKKFNPEIDENRKRIQPYFYQAAIKNVDASQNFEKTDTYLASLTKTCVTFSDLR